MIFDRLQYELRFLFHKIWHNLILREGRVSDEVYSFTEWITQRAIGVSLAEMTVDKLDENPTCFTPRPETKKGIMTFA